MIYLLTTRFRPGVQAQRDALGVTWNAHLEQLTPRIKLGGVTHDEAGVPNGVFMLLEATGIDVVRRFLAASPYVVGDLYESTSIDELRLEIGRLR